MFEVPLVTQLWLMKKAIKKLCFKKKGNFSKVSMSTSGNPKAKRKIIVDNTKAPYPNPSMSYLTHFMDSNLCAYSN